MGWYLGLDASTQSMSTIIIDTESGRVVVDESVGFDECPEYRCPQGFLESDDPLIKHADPLVWLAALEKLLRKLVDGGIDLSRVVAVSGSGQQHGTVYLNRRFLDVSAWGASAGLAAMIEPMLSRKTAPIWMDSSTTVECREIAEAVGGAEVVQRKTGSPPIERFSGPQIRRFSKDNPTAYNDTAVVHLVSSFIASVLVGRGVGVDIGDGAGMNLLNLSTLEWDEDMLAATAPGLRDRLPEVVSSDTIVGRIAPYFSDKYGFNPDVQIVAWSGDNPNSLIGVGAHAPGTAVVSLGTSHTYFAAMKKPNVDPEGYGHVFGNPAGGFMSLICFKNGALAQEEIRDRYGLTWEAFDDCLRSTPPGNSGNMMLPYFVSEITPLVLDAGAVRTGSDEFLNGGDACAAVRAVVESQALRLKIHSSWMASTPDTIRVTGGASVSTEVCRVLADVFNAELERLETGNSAGLGAAMRAAEAAGAASWKDLTDRFCQPVKGMNVTPDRDNAAMYEDMQSRYAAFAREHA
ncbi:MAG: carbohydrate kinase [Candidatus Pacebacteria bacterium]|nr:carbohydrate kinase [Candidatus Paceibacterota bacterium]